MATSGKRGATMNLEEYIKKIEILKNEITGCDNLIEFYANKKIKLIEELDRIYKIKLSESVADNE